MPVCLGPAVHTAPRRNAHVHVQTLRLCVRCARLAHRDVHAHHTPAELRGEAVECEALANPLPGAEGQGGHCNIAVKRCYSWFAGSCCLALLPAAWAQMTAAVQPGHRWAQWSHPIIHNLALGTRAALRIELCSANFS